MKNQLTKTQERVLQAITSFIHENGFPPTIREIMTIMGYASVNNVQRILSVLEQRGYLKRNLRGGARCIEVIRNQHQVRDTEKQIPILGTVAAGTPLFAEQNVEGYLTINPRIMGYDGDFILRVRGDSMRNANINDQDLVVVQKTNFPNNGDIIVALLDEEATVKRFYLEKNTIRLQPENDNYSPIQISRNDLYFRVLGKVRAVIHKIDKMGT
ncbi:MAG TPA: transcriptional repressor LexA [bacterium]|nr:transcriptional repressor LexA [bacterium]